MTVREALKELLVERSHVTHADVCERVGREVSRNAVSKVAISLGREWCVGVVGAWGGYTSRKWQP
jgi:hypothetical protein